MKILTIIGARPQFIKAATVSRTIKNYRDITEIIVHTGQHFDTNMSDVFFEEMNIPKPDYNLGIGGGTHGLQTGQMLIKLEEVILEQAPDWVLVYGDTNSTLAGALAASKLHIPIAHIEAGLRSFNKKMPEEINRILTDQVSEILFTPTEIADKNLLSEGVNKHKIKYSGDVMYDAALFYGKMADDKSTILEDIGEREKEYILCTVHRAENTDSSERLKSIFKNLEKIASDYRLVIPLHPRTEKALKELNFDFAKTDIHFIDPVGYIDMVKLEKQAGLIITDSGGVQKEAYFHKVPCLTLRNETEWLELVDKGYNALIKNIDKLASLVQSQWRRPMEHTENLYGDGEAALKIVETLIRFHSENSVSASD
ncbi:non-hydrolyzing UDP-N-acetylglucosamine 2-epimerase [Sinomicrobium sp.]